NREVRSPNGKMTAFVKDHNAYLRMHDTGVVAQLTQNGEEKNSYGSFSWSPDSRTLVAYRLEPGESGKAYLLDSTPKGQLRPKVTEWTYRLPGDKLDTREMWVFNAEQLKPIKVDLERIDLGLTPQLRWKKDGRHFTFQRTYRGHERVKLIE